MPTVTLRAPLADIAGGRRHPVNGTTVAEALTALERACPPIRGWVLDERGLIRRHVSVYVNRNPADEGTTVAEGDVLHVLPAITGG